MWNGRHIEMSVNILDSRNNNNAIGLTLTLISVDIISEYLIFDDDTF